MDCGRLQIGHVVFTAHDDIRARFFVPSPITLVRTTATLRPRPSDPDIVRFTTLSTLRELGRRLTPSRPVYNFDPVWAVRYGNTGSAVTRRVSSVPI